MSAPATTRLPAGARSTWWHPLLFPGCLLLALYAPVLISLVRQWVQDPEFGHGLLVPVFVAFLLRQRWSELRAVPVAPSSSGLVVMLCGCAALLVGSIGAELFISRVSLLVVLVGMVVFLAGWPMLRALAFPLACLLLAIPIPRIVYNELTFPLQLLASRLAVRGLDAGGIPALQEGNIILLPNTSLEVVEACSGIRSLMSLLALTVFWGHLSGAPRWVRAAMLALTVPIAVAANALRVMLTGVLTYRYGLQALEGPLHAFFGWLVFMAALGGVAATQFLLCRVARNAAKEEHAG